MIAGSSCDTEYLILCHTRGHAPGHMEHGHAMQHRQVWRLGARSLLTPYRGALSPVRARRARQLANGKRYLLSPPGGRATGSAGLLRTAAGSRSPSGGGLPRSRPVLPLVGPGLVAQPGGLPCDRLVKFPFGRALEDSGHLGQAGRRARPRARGVRSRPRLPRLPSARATWRDARRYRWLCDEDAVTIRTTVSHVSSLVDLYGNLAPECEDRQVRSGGILRLMYEGQGHPGHEGDRNGRPVCAPARASPGSAGRARSQSRNRVALSRSIPGRLARRHARRNGCSGAPRAGACRIPG